MNILMMTNTFTPHVGGVARSVEAFTNEYRRRGHRVIVVAPEFEGAPAEEDDVIRLPALQHFNGSDFSIPVPIPGFLALALAGFAPDVVHSHHPFLLGDTALRISAAERIPVVFTHHTRYEQYTHYVPGDSAAMKHFAVELAVGYSNLCDSVVAPSETIRDLLVAEGVESPIEVIPTGVDVEHFARGDGAAFRAAHNVPADAFVVGHVGRLAPEKNLEFLARAVAAYLREAPSAWLLIAGTGPSEEAIRQACRQAGVEDRLCLVGILQRQELVDAYHAMDVFAFASQSETQGMVLTEAMAAGTPVVAVDASGVREVVRDGKNGRLLAEENVDSFREALAWLAGLSDDQHRELLVHVRETAEQFSMPRCAQRALDLYARLAAAKPRLEPVADSLWARAVRSIEREWAIWSNFAEAAADALFISGDEPSPSASDADATPGESTG